MENKVYYGEYTLRHWISLILKGNITLPEYQRYFVWNESKSEHLISAFKSNQFVPPVTIGAFKIDGGSNNLILDGQQRLTSILLAYLGVYPDVSKYRKSLEKLANENDDFDEEIEELDNVLEWNFKYLTDKGKSKDQIVNSVPEGSYKRINFGLTDDILDKTFLGFSYIVPGVSEDSSQQKYYSSVFRSINVTGQSLLPQESRASLYYLNKDLVEFFSPSFFKPIAVKSAYSEQKSDFVRYISMLFQYNKDKKENSVAAGYKQNMERYYELFINSVVSDEDSPRFGKFSDVFPDYNYRDNLEIMRNNIQKILPRMVFSSIIEMDVYLFGMIYVSLIKGSDISVSNKAKIIQDLDSSITDFRADRYHAKSPGNLKYLRSRIKRSIDIYEKY